MVIFQSVSKMAMAAPTANQLFQQQLLRSSLISAWFQLQPSQAMGTMSGSHSHFTAADIDYAVKRVELESCGALYQKLRQKKRIYKKAPPHGLRFDMEYADSQPSMEASDKPTILALHGAPGSHIDFGPLIKHLSSTGARVIAPSFPTYSLTVETGGLYQHSSEEKTEMLRDFLRAIRVSEIDMIMAHSSAVYPAVKLWKHADPASVRSLALFNPSGHRRIMAMKPAIVIDSCVRFYGHPLGRKVFRKIGRLILKAIRARVKLDELDNAILSGTTMLRCANHELASHLQALNEHRVPVLMSYSENDALVDLKIFEEMQEMLDSKEEHVTRYDANGTLVKKGINDSLRRIIRFKNGGHYSFLKYGHIVNAEVSAFLNECVTSRSPSLDQLEENLIARYVRSPSGDSSVEQQPQRIKMYNF